MSRLPLIHFEGALFHITARGNNKQLIFNQQKDFQRYLKSLGEAKKKFPFKLYSFVLMPNHIHLLIEVKKHPINKIMQAIQTGYTMYFNKKYEQTGHLFQGRYHSFLVDKDSYLIALICYINLNSVRAGLVSDPKDYPWSSHHAFLNSDHEFNKIIDRDEILNFFSPNPKKQTLIYQEYILDNMNKKWEDVLKKPEWGQIIGSEKFIKQVGSKLRKIIKSRASVK